MAKRTNKTNHVMSLLSNKDDSSEVLETKAEVTENVEVESKQEIKDLAEEIRQSLENSLDELVAESEEEITVVDSIDKIAENIKPEDVIILKDASAANEEVEEHFSFVSVMEVLVKERVEEFMAKLSVCTCLRCKVDVMALALTNLPPKYVVKDKRAVTPLISVYSHRYENVLATEITKACIRVNEFPHHNEDGTI